MNDKNHACFGQMPSTCERLKKLQKEIEFWKTECKLMVEQYRDFGLDIYKLFPARLDITDMIAKEILKHNEKVKAFKAELPQNDCVEKESLQDELCHDCLGTKRVNVTRKVFGVPVSQWWKDCKTCKGSGKKNIK